MAPTLMLGKTLGHYQIEAELGHGGMGVVYRARDTHLDRAAVIKILRPEAVANPDRKRRFILEAKAASALNHPNIVTIYDFDSEGGVDYIAMEYVEGRTLDSMIGHRSLKWSETVGYAVQIADALARAHRAGIVHRDLKPANVMVTREGLVKVLDFGLAKLSESLGQDSADATLSDIRVHTEDGTILGSAAYMSPEQVAGGLVDSRSDIFSLGSILYEMLTGDRAFAGGNKIATMSAILHKDPQPLAGRVPGLPLEMERIVSRCLRRDPSRRFLLMDEVRLALEDLKEDSASGSSEQVSPRPRRVWPAVIAGSLAVAVLCAWWWLARERKTPEPAVAVLTRVTSDSGLTTDPALSVDGKMLAYASDRGGGSLDIWVQHLGGGAPARLTRDLADDCEPAFSPDGGRVAFRSNRGAGGIYEIPVLGGEEQLIIKNGRNPRYSPDGRWIAAITDSHSSVGGTYPILVVPSSGGTARPLSSELGFLGSPVWSPDSRYLVALGRERAGRVADPAWWLIPLDGGPGSRMNMNLPVQQVSWYAQRATNPEAWSPDGRHIVYSAASGNSVNLWRVAVDPRTHQIAGLPERLTFGTGIESNPSLAASGAIAFSSGQYGSDVWKYPLDANRGKVTGALEQVTQDAAVDEKVVIDHSGGRIGCAT